MRICPLPGIIRIYSGSLTHAPRPILASQGLHGLSMAFLLLWKHWEMKLSHISRIGINSQIPLLPRESNNHGPNILVLLRLIEPAMYPCFLLPWAGPSNSLLSLLLNSLPAPPSTLLLQMQPSHQVASIPLPETFLLPFDNKITSFYNNLKKFHCCFCSHKMDCSRSNQLLEAGMCLFSPDRDIWSSPHPNPAREVKVVLHG